MQMPFLRTLLDVFWSRPAPKDTPAERTVALTGFRTIQDPTPSTRVAEPGGPSAAAIFVEQAQRLVSHSAQTAKPVPFANYYPNHSAMNPAQRRWYFYWRGQVRRGQHLPTDAAYVLVYAYELINGVGIKTYQEGFEGLYGLWRNYRNQPILDRSLMGWTEDFALLHGLHPQLAAFRQELAHNWRETYYPNALSEVLLKPGWAKAPLPLVAFLAQVELGSSSFYSSNSALFERYVPLVLGHIDQALIAGSGKGILDHVGPPPAFIGKRHLFSGAIYAETKQEIPVLQAPLYLEHLPLRQFLKTTLRYTEQRLRQVTGYRPMSQPIELPLWFKTQIDAVIKVGQPGGSER